MATLVRGLLNANQMDVRVFCAGMSYVGIGVSGTFVGTLSFFMQQFSSEGGMFGPDATRVYPYPGAAIPSDVTSTGVASVTFTGTTATNYYWPVQNCTVFSARVSAYTSGSPIVTLAAALDGSWADAFLPASGGNGININKSVVGGQNILIIPANPNLPRRLKSLVVTVAPEQGAGGSSSGATTAVWNAYPPLRIYDGAYPTDNIMFAADLNTTVPFQYDVPLPDQKTDFPGISDEGLAGTPANPITIFLASPGLGITTNINAEVGY